jgi:hypothetical protein
MNRCGQPEANLTEVPCLDRHIRNGSPDQTGTSMIFFPAMRGMKMS